MRDLLTTIYRYRGFIWSSVKRDFQARYQTSMLGALWLVLQPLSMILVYTRFSEVMKARMPDNTGSFAYSIYLCSGVLTSGLFTEMLDKGQSVFINNANLIKKTQFSENLSADHRDVIGGAKFRDYFQSVSNFYHCHR